MREGIDTKGNQLARSGPWIKPAWHCQRCEAPHNNPMAVRCRICALERWPVRPASQNRYPVKWPKVDKGGGG
eukprot:5171064-Alexandrium_andersonii.AAC.1